MIIHLIADQVPRTLDRSPFSLVAFEPRMPVRYDMDLAVKLKYRYGDDLCCATLNADSIPGKEWFDQVFRTSLSAVGRQQHGYYVFQGPLVIGFYPFPEVGREAAYTDKIGSYAVERIELAKIEVAPFQDEHTQAEPPRASEPRAHFAPTRPTVDPYKVLGVARNATPREIKVAYVQALKLNHPDKVGHMSEAIQRFATQQTLKIQTAWSMLQDRISSPRSSTRPEHS